MVGGVGKCCVKELPRFVVACLLAEKEAQILLRVAIAGVEGDGAAKAFFSQGFFAQFVVDVAAHVVSGSVVGVGSQGAFDFIKGNVVLLALHVAYG